MGSEMCIRDRICDVLDNIDNEEEIKKIKEKVLNLCSQFPVYSSSKQAVA